MQREMMSLTEGQATNSMQTLQLTAIPTDWVLVPRELLVSLLTGSQVQDLLISSPVVADMEDPPNQLPPVQQVQPVMSITMVASAEMMTASASTASAEMVMQPGPQTGMSLPTGGRSQPKKPFVPRRHTRASAKRGTGTLSLKADKPKRLP